TISPLVHFPVTFCSMGVRVLLIVYPLEKGSLSGIAARLCMVAQGFPVPSCVMVSFSLASGHPNITSLPSGDFVQSTVSTLLSNSEVVEPVTGMDSNFCENLSIASTPQAFATVVSQCP